MSTIGFINRKDEVRTYTWNGQSIEVSNGEVLTQSANEFRKRTAKGNNLTVTTLTKKNWESAARIHADKAGFWKTASERQIALLPKEGTTNPEPELKIVQDWIDGEKGGFEGAFNNVTRHSKR